MAIFQFTKSGSAPQGFITVQAAGKSFVIGDEEPHALIEVAEAAVAAALGANSYLTAVTGGGGAVTVNGRSGTNITLLPSDLAAAQDLIDSATVLTGAQSVAAGRRLRIDISAGNGSGQLPTAPAVGTRCAIKVVAVNATPGTFTATLLAGGTDTFNKPGGSASLTFTSLFSGASVRYGADGSWTVENTDPSLGQPLGAAKAGSDGNVGGPSGTPILPSITAAATAANSASGVVPYGLAIGKGGCVVPVGVRAHLIGDNAFGVPAGAAGSVMYRTFHPLSDPTVLDVLPVFNNPLAMVGFSGGDVADAPNAITISASAELSDGTILPFSFNGGSHTATINANYGQVLTPDAPINIGAQVSAVDKFSVTIPLTGFWLRIWVQTAASRTDTSGVTNGSATVTDAAIAAADQGAVVTGTSIPGSLGNTGQTYVGTVTPGVSYLLSSSPNSQVNVTFTGTTNASASLTISRVIPLNLGPYANLDNFTANGAADLTLPGSGNVSGGSGSYLYGPALILGKPKVRKPIVAVVSDSILDGYSEDFHSAFFGPVARACVNLGLPLVKASKGGETAAAWAAPTSRKYRAPFLDGCTHAIVSLGTNDGVLTTAAGAGGVTTLLNRLTTIGTFLAAMGVKPYVCTVPPRTSSSDGWSTTGGQNPVSGSVVASLASLNSTLRAIPAPYVGVYDLALTMLSAQDSGLFNIAANGRRVTDAVTTISSNQLSSATANFTNADIGTGIFVAGAVVSTGATITAVTNSTTATMSTNATAGVSGAVAGIGAYAYTIDGVHPNSALTVGTISTQLQTLFSTFTV